jgi:hypothetical protein
MHRRSGFGAAAVDKLLFNLTDIREQEGDGLAAVAVGEVSVAAYRLSSLPLKLLLKKPRDTIAETYIHTLESAASSMRDMEVRAPLEALQNMHVAARATQTRDAVRNKI